MKDIKPKVCRNKKLFIVGITVGSLVLLYAALYIAFFRPLPFSEVLWENHTNRHRMTDSITQTVVGMHKDYVILMLGEPDGLRSPSFPSITYRLRDEKHHWFWQHLMIFLDEDGFARGVLVGHPSHVA